MKIEDMLKDPEKYHDNVRIRRANYIFKDGTNGSLKIWFVKELIKFDSESFNEDLNADDWEVVDERL